MIVRYPQITVERVEALARLGLRKKEVAGALGISEDTFQRLRKEHLALDESFWRGRASGIEAVASAVMRQALNGCVFSQKLYLYHAAGWRPQSGGRGEADKVEQPSFTIVFSPLQSQAGSEVKTIEAVPEIISLSVIEE